MPAQKGAGPKARPRRRKPAKKGAEMLIPWHLRFCMKEPVALHHSQFEN